MLFAESFYWDLTTPSRAFSRSSSSALRMPTALQAVAVLGHAELPQGHRARQVRRSADVVKAVKGMPIQDAFAKNGKVRDDGKMIHDIKFVRVKTPQSPRPRGLLHGAGDGARRAGVPPRLQVKHPSRRRR